MYSNDLSNSKKDKLFPIKIDEQNYTCPLCKMPFEPSIFYEQSTDFDHLDRNEKNHNPNNLAVVHKECNLIKKYCAEFLKGKQSELTKLMEKTEFVLHG